MFDVESVNLLTAVLVLCCLSSLHVVDPHFSVDLCHLWRRIMTAGIGLVWTMSSSHAAQIAPGSPFVLLERGERCQLRWKQVVRYSVDNGDGYLEFIKRSWLNRTLQASNVMIPQSFNVDNASLTCAIPLLLMREGVEDKRELEKKSFTGKEKDGQNGVANTLQCYSRACLNDYRLAERKCLLSAILISAVFFLKIL